MELTVLSIFVVFCSVNAQFDPFSGLTPKKEKPKINELSKKLPLKPVPTDKHKANRDDIMKKMREVKSMSDFLAKFQPKKGLSAQVSAKGNQAYLLVKSRSVGTDGQTITKEKPIRLATHAECTPRPKCRDISYLSSTYNGLIIPPCITYPQCGGCCYNHDIKECAPKTYIDETINIFVVSYEDSAWSIVPFKYKRHTNCTCECKVKKDHCIGAQVYDKDNCYCYCPFWAKKSCPKNKQWSSHYCDCRCRNPNKNCGEKKIWNEDSCSCQCIKKKKCDKGKAWDVASCHCMDPFFIG